VKFMVEYPIQSEADGGAWLYPGNIAEFARVADEAGFDGLALTDHPAPGKRWLTQGGHETFDPFAGLAYFAAVTERVQLMTVLTVVPYRNPLLLAKSMTTVDLLSGGRTIFVCGTGYLRGEFHSLGVDFSERNELFDEAIEVLKGVWSTDEFHYEGRHFTAKGATLMPRPVSQPHPPLWLGGNAAVVRERVAAWGSGWAPLFGAGGPGSTVRTAALPDEAALVEALRDLSERLDKHGRSMADIDVLVGGDGATLANGADAALEAIGHQAELGITWTMASSGSRSDFAKALDGLRAYGEQVIAKA
jgi:probable F420-dependent oxidoreductase